MGEEGKGREEEIWQKGGGSNKGFDRSAVIWLQKGFVAFTMQSQRARSTLTLDVAESISLATKNQKRIGYKMILFPKYSTETFLKDIKLRVESGGSVSAIQPESGWSLLHLAAEFQDIPAIEYLVEAGCDINQRDVNGQTPLHIAVDSDIDGAIQTQEPLEYKAKKRLIELGADTTVQDDKGETPIDWIGRYGEWARKRFNEVV